MARVTVEDCLQHVGNRFALVVLASERARQLARGATALVECENKPGVTALREIAAGSVYFDGDIKDAIADYLAELKQRGIDQAQAGHKGA